MKMVKKRNIVITVLALILALASLLMFACGDKSNKNNPYETYQASISAYKEDATLFKNGTINGIATDFYFDHFERKNSSGLKLEDDTNYILLNAYGMNFIEKYYVLLADLGSLNYSTLNDNINALNKSFDVVKVESKNVVNADENADFELYNGFFSRYKASALDFINNVYKTAISLGDFLIGQANYTAALGTDEQTSEQVSFYVDYQVLRVFDDFRNLFMSSAKGKTYSDETVYANAKLRLSNFASLSVNYKKAIDKDTMTSFMDLSNVLDGERNITKQACDKFSIYYYVEELDSSMVAYLKEDGNADTYYLQLQKYYSDSNSFLKLYHDYLTANIFE